MSPYSFGDLFDYLGAIVMLAIVIGIFQTLGGIFQVLGELWQSFNIWRLGKEEYERRSYKAYLKTNPEARCADSCEKLQKGKLTLTQALALDPKASAAALASYRQAALYWEQHQPGWKERALQQLERDLERYAPKQ